jgi:hypothetical protein
VTHEQVIDLHARTISSAFRPAQLRVNMTNDLMPGRVDREANRFSNQCVARQRELATLSAWLADPMRRLVTVRGAAGAGKTRLVAELIQVPPARFSDGCSWISSREVRDGRHALVTIARQDSQSIGARPLVESNSIPARAGHCGRFDASEKSVSGHSNQVNRKRGVENRTNRNRSCL